MRRFTMPTDAEGANIDARFDSGVLTVKIPKSASKKSETTEIEVR